MESKIPIPTDNIFKFYALFGLLLFIFSIGSSLYVIRSTNELVFQTVIESESIRQIDNPSTVDQTKKLLLDKRLEIARADKDFLTKSLGALGGVALALMGYGFWKWHTCVQPIQDELLQLQVKKLRHEVGQLAGLTSVPSKPIQSAPTKVQQADDSQPES